METSDSKARLCKHKTPAPFLVGSHWFGIFSFWPNIHRQLCPRSSRNLGRPRRRLPPTLIGRESTSNRLSGGLLPTAASVWTRVVPALKVKAQRSFQACMPLTHYCFHSLHMGIPNLMSATSARGISSGNVFKKNFSMSFMQPGMIPIGDSIGSHARGIHVRCPKS